MKKWLLAAGALLVGLGFYILGQPERKLKKVVAHRDNLMLDNTKASQVKAEKFGKKADGLQAEAIMAGELGKAEVDKVGTQSETIGSVLDSWRKPSSV